MKRMILALGALVIVLAGCATGEGKEDQVMTEHDDTVTAGLLTGTWVGSLDAGGTSLRLVFRFDGSGSGVMDSPDQGATDIPVTGVNKDGDTIRIDVGSLHGRFEGSFTAEGTLDGMWIQGTAKLPLTLHREASAPQVLRPQEPKPPYPYIVRDVSFPSGDLTLAGTLTLPEGDGPFPGVVLVTGSGPQNRNEELLGHKPFLVIADYLTRRGIAVLRYDDRGTAESQGNFASATTEDLAGDARAAMDYLRQDSRVDPDHVGLLGHSEGGTIGIYLGARVPEIDFLVLMAPSVIKGRDLLLLQSKSLLKASGASQDTIDLSQDVNTKIYDAVLGDLSPEALRAELETQFARVGVSGDALDAQIAAITSPWFRFFLGYDPSEDVPKLTMPVLALFGSLDLQVDAVANRTPLEDLATTSVDVKTFEGLNHLFQRAQSGLPSEYGSIAETVNPDVLKTIGDWILDKS